MRLLSSAAAPLFAILLVQAFTTSAGAQVWPQAKIDAVLDKTQVVRLAPDLSNLTPGEHVAVAKLIAAGEVFQQVYEEQRHAAWADTRRLLSAQTPQAAKLRTLFRLFQGPIATTLDNKREPFLPVEMTPPGQNVYPWGIEQAEVDAFVTAHPDQRDTILAPRSVVRRATAENLRRDLGKLKQYPALDTLHPGLKTALQALAAKPSSQVLYAAPYSVAYADQMIRAHGLLNEAADAVAADDGDLAKFLRNRSRDLLSDDYESGDAAWVMGRFNHLNLLAGAYEPYADELYAQRAFYGLTIFSNRPETAAISAAVKGLQGLEDSLPYAPHKRVREDIPLGAYDVVADFGETRTYNTATIVPNEAYIVRRYGRRLFMRANVMLNPEIFAVTHQAWAAAMAPAHGGDLTPEGNFNRTLWHEIGHYLGVDATATGESLDTALQADALPLEEMKADLISLYLAEALRKQGYYTPAMLHAVYAGGINRILLNNPPRRDQPYNTMELIQLNYYLEHGLLSFDAASGRLSIDYGRYHDVVGALLAETLKLQRAGDRVAAEAFIDRYTHWDEQLHGVVAKHIREQQRYRYKVFTYGALGE